MFFSMNRILRIAVYSDFLVKANVVLSRSVRNFSKVKVEYDSDVIQISFKYLDKNHKILDAKGQEAVGNILSRIKQIVDCRRHDVLSRLRTGEFKLLSESFYGDDLQEDAEVYLMHGEEFVKSSVPNIDAWTDGSFLKIGSCMYEVEQQLHQVKTLSLPETILAEVAIRPHFGADCTKAQECSFVWYHSVSEEEVKLYNTETDMVKVNEQWWVKVHEGMIYWTSRHDIGRRLRVVFTPKSQEREGRALVAESKNAVQSGPEHFPFQERHLYTQQLTDSDSIRCLTYNTLANMYAERKKFPYSSKVALDRYYRKQILMRELLGYNGDILCLQEVQERMFEYDFLPVLQNAGFNSFYARKNGRRSEGVATFFRTSKFKVIIQKGVHLNEVIKNKDIFYDLLKKVAGNIKDVSKLLTQHSVLQVVLLEHIDNPRRRILVANTHLYSNKNAPEVRLLQSALCVGYIEHLLKSQDSVDATAVLFCGDFNSMPESTVLKFLLEGSYECCPSWSKTSSGPSVDTTIRHSLTLDSACGFPRYTNYTEEFKGCLDYIFYSTDLFSVEEIVPLPGEEVLARDVGLPSELFPSDHLPLICTLKWK